MNPCKHVTYPALVVLVLLAGSAAYAGEEPDSAELRAEVNLLRREVARLREEVADLRKAVTEMRASLAGAAPTETPQAQPTEGATAAVPQPPTPSGAPSPGSLASLLARIPGKFMPQGTEATVAQKSALSDWGRDNLTGQKVRVRIKVDSIGSDSLDGIAVGEFVVNGRRAHVRVYAEFGKAGRDGLLPLTKGMMVEVSGTLPKYAEGASYSLQPTGEEIGEGENKHWVFGWDGKDAIFSLYLTDCRIGAVPAAAAP